MQQRLHSGSAHIEPEAIRAAVDALQQEKPRYGERRGDLRLDCLGFAKSVYAALGEQRSSPSFSSSPEFLRKIDLRPFEECAVGDIVFFRHKRLPRDAKRRARVFTHVGVKYGEAEVAHMTKKGGLSVEPLEDILQERVVVSRKNIDDIVWNDEKAAFVLQE
jgi:cell wall-associated NlpC family hydrolase